MPIIFLGPMHSSIFLQMTKSQYYKKKTMHMTQYVNLPPLDIDNNNIQHYFKSILISNINLTSLHNETINTMKSFPYWYFPYCESFPSFLYSSKTVRYCSRRIWEKRQENHVWHIKLLITFCPSSSGHQATCKCSLLFKKSYRKRNSSGTFIHIVLSMK